MIKRISAEEYKATVKKRRKHPEDDLCIECNHVALRLSKKYDFYWFHVPNGGVRSKLQALRFKQMGVRSGVYDYCIVRDHITPGWIEVKVGTGKRSDSQKEFAIKMEELGCPCNEVRSVEEFEETLRKMLQWP